MGHAGIPTDLPMQEASFDVDVVEPLSPGRGEQRIERCLEGLGGRRRSPSLGRLASAFLRVRLELADHPRGRLCDAHLSTLLSRDAVPGQPDEVSQRCLREPEVLSDAAQLAGGHGVDYTWSLEQRQALSLGSRPRWSDARARTSGRAVPLAPGPDGSARTGSWPRCRGERPRPARAARRWPSPFPPPPAWRAPSPTAAPGALPTERGLLEPRPA